MKLKRTSRITDGGWEDYGHIRRSYVAFNDGAYVSKFYPNKSFFQKWGFDEWEAVWFFDEFQDRKITIHLEPDYSKKANPNKLGENELLLKGIKEKGIKSKSWDHRSSSPRDKKIHDYVLSLASPRWMYEEIEFSYYKLNLRVTPKDYEYFMSLKKPLVMRLEVMLGERENNQG